MSEDAPHRNNVADALKNGTGTILARGLVIIGFPAMFALSAWVGSRLVSQLDNVADLVARQHEDTVRSINGLDVRISVTERDVRYLTERRP